MDLIVRRVGVEEALVAILEVIRIRRSFDPALPNDLALYFAFAEFIPSLRVIVFS